MTKIIYRSTIKTIVVIILTIMFGFILACSSVSADDSVVDDVSIEVPISCSMEGTGMTSHNANIVNGTYQANIGTTTIKAYCNDSSGFAIYAIGYTDDEYGKNVLTNTTLGSTADIVTGTATSGSTSNWAMKLTAPTSPTPTYPLTLDNSFGSYHSVPSEYTKVAHRDSATDIGTNAEGSTLITTYAAFMSQTQPAGTYIGQVRYTLVHPANETPLQPRPATAGCINYFANASIVIGEMGEQCQDDNHSAISSGSSITLYASNFKRDGYGFAGWNDKFDYSGTNYGPNETITAPSDVQTSGLSLYAIWVKTQGTLQNWNGCNSLTQDSVTALIDNRDNNTYAVAKLADNKCWMIENLRLDDGPELSATNTHNPSLPLTNTWWYNAGKIYPKSTSNHLSATSTDSWCNIVDSPICSDQSMLHTDNTTKYTANTTSNQNSNIYGYGNYYNWYSATAGQGTFSMSNGDVVGDICPVGWHLPTEGDIAKEANLLDIAMGGTGASSSSSTTPTGAVMSSLWRSYPNNFVFSGYLSSSLAERRTSGSYWSSSAKNGNNANYIFINKSSVGMYSNSKYQGMMIRCVADI